MQRRFEDSRQKNNTHEDRNLDGEDGRVQKDDGEENGDSSPRSLSQLEFLTRRKSPMVRESRHNCVMRLYPCTAANGANRRMRPLLLDLRQSNGRLFRMLSAPNAGLMHLLQIRLFQVRDLLIKVGSFLLFRLANHDPCSPDSL